MNRTRSSLLTSAPADTPEVEKTLAFDMIRRGLPLAPLVVFVAWLVRGGPGAWSALLAIAVVLVNLLVAAVGLTLAARISLAMIMVAALGGFAVRMAAVTVVVILVKDQAWIDLPVLAVSILVTHLGLLAWETRYVSATLAYPDLAPEPPARADTPPARADTSPALADTRESP